MKSAKRKLEFNPDIFWGEPTEISQGILRSKWFSEQKFRENYRPIKLNADRKTCVEITKPKFEAAFEEFENETLKPNDAISAKQLRLNEVKVPIEINLDIIEKFYLILSKNASLLKYWLVR